MKTLMNRVRRFMASEDGPTAVEYAVMLALIIVACIVVIQNLATSVNSTFQKTTTTLNTANGS